MSVAMSEPARRGWERKTDVSRVCVLKACAVAVYCWWRQRLISLYLSSLSPSLTRAQKTSVLLSYREQTGTDAKLSRIRSAVDQRRGRQLTSCWDRIFPRGDRETRYAGCSVGSARAPASEQLCGRRCSHILPSREHGQRLAVRYSN